jgi:4-hydroxy-tetrahydrodipicolinate reductase
MRISIFGAAGRMGQAIAELAKENPDFEIAGRLEFDESVCIGQGEPKIIKASNIDEIMNATDVFIDFTSVKSSLENLVKLVNAKKPVVIGTTGFTAPQKNKISEYAKIIPIVLSPNMSVGVNVMFELVKEAAKKLEGYDIEIIEAHHNKKKDAPSGTAAKLGEIIACELDRNLEKAAVYGRNDLNRPRTKEEIGIVSVRGGDIVGDHTVMFAGEGERIEIIHRAQSRNCFAQGALTAAKWLYGKPAGLYSMQNVLRR